VRELGKYEGGHAFDSSASLAGGPLGRSIEETDWSFVTERSFIKSSPKINRLCDILPRYRGAFAAWFRNGRGRYRDYCQEDFYRFVSRWHGSVLEAGGGVKPGAYRAPLRAVGLDPAAGLQPRACMRSTP